MVRHQQYFCIARCISFVRDEAPSTLTSNGTCPAVNWWYRPTTTTTPAPTTVVATTVASTAVAEKSGGGGGDSCAELSVLRIFFKFTHDMKEAMNFIRVSRSAAKPHPMRNYFRTKMNFASMMIWNLQSIKIWRKNRKSTNLFRLKETYKVCGCNCGNSSNLCNGQFSVDNVDDAYWVHHLW